MLKCSLSSWVDCCTSEWIIKIWLARLIYADTKRIAEGKKAQNLSVLFKPCTVHDRSSIRTHWLFELGTLHPLCENQSGWGGEEHLADAQKWSQSHPCRSQDATILQTSFLSRRRVMQTFSLSVWNADEETSARGNSAMLIIVSFFIVKALSASSWWWCNLNIYQLLNTVIGFLLAP